MKALLRVSMVAALAAWTSPAFAGPVTIQPGAYSGRYFINGVGGPYFGNQTIDLSAGTYFIDLGAEIAGSGFTVDIDASGTASNVTPAAAAGASGNTITLKTTSITIVAGGYTGRYFLSTSGTDVEFHGDQAIVLVPGLSYALDNGTEAASAESSSDFVFSLDAAGMVSTSSAAATGSGNTLTL